MVYIPAALRAALIGGSLLVLVFIIYSSVKASMDVHYAVLWITMAALILLIGLWPELAGAVADWIGFQSVSNFVFLAMTAVLFLLSYYSFLKISRMNEDIRKLNYKVASLQKEVDDAKKES